MQNKNNPSFRVSIHILPTCANFLGICFLILSFIKVNKLGDSTYLDELLILPIVVFFLACIFSYISLRKEDKFTKYEDWADRFFIAGLISITLISLTFIFEILV
jgi:hypothetical protein